MKHREGTSCVEDLWKLNIFLSFKKNFLEELNKLIPFVIHYSSSSCNNSFVISFCGIVIVYSVSDDLSCWTSALRGLPFLSLPAGSFPGWFQEFWNWTRHMNLQKLLLYIRSWCCFCHLLWSFNNVSTLVQSIFLATQ